MAEQLASGKLVLDHPAEAVARLRINHPAKRNALDHEILDAIAAAMPRLDDGIALRCVILTGSGRSFSAGYDIGDIPDESFEADAEALVAHPFTAAMEAISDHPYPVIAAINGHALGGGLELAIRCDLRLCSSDAKLGMPPAKLGLIYGHTGLRHFIDTIGVPRTRELFLGGEVLDAERAEWIGLVGDLVPAAKLESAAIDLARSIAANAPISLRGNKRAINMLAGFDRLSEEQERELIELRKACFRSEDFREGVRAFAEKRRPRWTGR